MTSAVRADRSESEDGFSLVELLVVVIIIGILAAIAIPRYLDQRQAAYDAAAIADLRSLVSLEVAVVAADGGFTDDPDRLVEDEGWQSTSGIVICALVHGDGTLSLASWHPAGTTTYSWSSVTSLIDAVAAAPPADCTAAITTGAQPLT